MFLMFCGVSVGFFFFFFISSPSSECSNWCFELVCLCGQGSRTIRAYPMMWIIIKRSTLLTWLLLLVGGLLCDVGTGNDCWFLCWASIKCSDGAHGYPLFCWNFVLLPFHKYSGNEADDDLMMENILPSIVYCSRCRISNDWMLYFKACPGVYDDLWYGGTSSGVAWRLYSLCEWLMYSKVGGCRTKHRVYSRRTGCLLIQRREKRWVVFSIFFACCLNRSDWIAHIMLSSGPFITWIFRYLPEVVPRIWIGIDSLNGVGRLVFACISRQM